MGIDIVRTVLGNNMHLRSINGILLRLERARPSVDEQKININLTIKGLRTRIVYGLSLGSYQIRSAIFKYCIVLTSKTRLPREHYSVII